MSLLAISFGAFAFPPYVEFLLLGFQVLFLSLLFFVREISV